MNGPEIRAARHDDRPSVDELLRRGTLPLDGVDDAFPDGYVVACSNNLVVAAAGLEEYGSVGLLRSVVVIDSLRGTGLGRLLVADRLDRARTRRLERVFLLTTTAATYFERLGFSRASRDEAPPELLASPEFASACPTSAICLVHRP